MDIELSVPPISCFLSEEVALPAQGWIKLPFLKLCTIVYSYPKNVNLPWMCKDKTSGYLLQ